MRHRLLFVSPGVPGFGGLSTACHELFQRVRRDRAPHEVHLLVLMENATRADAAGRLARYESAGTGSTIHEWRLATAPGQPDSRLGALVDAIDPDVVVAFGHRPTLAVKIATPHRRVVFVTGTCRQAQDWVTARPARDAVTLARELARPGTAATLVHEEERRAVQACDLMITNSTLTLSMMERFFPHSAGKIYPTPVWFAEWIGDNASRMSHLARPFAHRDIGVCFVAASWRREEKNYRWVEALAARLPEIPVHVVGDVPHRIPLVTHHGMLSREALFAVLGRARCVASVSRIDAAPGVLFEASAMGCNVVASRNCGNWELCHPALLADPFDIERFAGCIRNAQPRPLPDRLEIFRSTRSYDDLLATLEAFAQPFEPVER